MSLKGLMTSNKSDWETPQWLFDDLNNKFHFTLDPCANRDNHKCDNWFSKESDGLNKSWQGHTVFMNPPYGREIGKWVEKAYREYQKGVTVVALLPARTDTRWFHNYIYGKAEIRFIKGRLKFSGSKNSAPFPSMIVIYKEV